MTADEMKSLVEWASGMGVAELHFDGLSVKFRDRVELVGAGDVPVKSIAEAVGAVAAAPKEQPKTIKGGSYDGLEEEDAFAHVARG